MRIGNGYDVHRFAENRDLFLGGVKIPYELGLLGHSDADVLLHAIMDALLLKEVCVVLGAKGYKIVNIDSIVIAQKPKLAPYIEQMRKNIADACKIDISQVSVKATTEEKLGFTGRLEGISSHAVCLIE